MIKRLVISVIAVLLLNISWAQEGSYYTSGLEEFRKGVELFDKEKYASARNTFETFIENGKNQHQNLIIDAHFYRALCAAELFNNDAEFLISHFLVEFPESPRTKELYFVMGNFQYIKKHYSKALKWYKKVDLYDLSQQEVEEYHFKVGYSHFMKEEYKLASEHFLKIKETESKYAVPAKYFYAHIAFDEKKWETALKEFKKLEDDELFGPIVPYYIIQIYFYQNKNDEIIAYAPDLLDSTQTRRVPEISRILGEAFYKTEKFAQAVPYLITYKEKGENFTREDTYQLAYAYYRTNDFNAAANQFESISKQQDSLTHQAFYHLADCYLKLGKKDKALLAFQEASLLNIIPDVTEDAMYNYAKLSYELSNSPFNDAIRAIKDYLKAYPNSRHHDEAYTYLSKVFLSTKNYQLAIQTIEEIGKKTPELIESYQRVTYFRALEYYTDLNFDRAIVMFNKSIENSKYDLKIRALAKYWRAEAYYKIGDFEKSFEDFNDYVLTSGAYGSEEFKDAHYNMAYALFKLHDYTQAIVWYRKYVDFTHSEKLTKIGDAYNRIGDCYFISKNYNFAIDYYEKSIATNRKNVDYAIFQKAFSQGLLKKYKEEIATLENLTNNYSNSTYVDDGLFEIANAYKYLNAFDSAIEYYMQIINNFPSSAYRSIAYLQVGMLQYNGNKDEQALSHFKTLISEYPKSEEAQKALIIMKNIYIDVNNVDEYIEFANSHSVETEVGKIEADSLTYISAERLYMADNCTEALPSFKKYIEKYPDGRYLLNAHYFKSDCEFRDSEYNSALESFSYIINQNANEYTEEALLKSAYINYIDSDFVKTAELYEQLVKHSSNNSSLKTAKIGLMRCYFNLKDYPKAIQSAMSVLTVSEDAKELNREVHFVIGKSFFETKDFEGAYTEFQLIADQAKSKEGAEANYRMIQIEYERENYDKAIELINVFKNSNSPHQEWVARSFMIWSDIFRIREDYFMAKATLESIIKYYPKENDGVKALAKEKLVIIEEQEVDELELKKALDVEINLNELEKDNKLFELEDPPIIKPNEEGEDSMQNTNPVIQENLAPKEDVIMEEEKISPEDINIEENDTEIEEVQNEK